MAYNFPHIQDLDALKEYFFRNRRALVTIYPGDTKTNSNILYLNDDPGLDLNDVWENIEDTILRHTPDNGARFTLYFPKGLNKDNKKESNGAYTTRLIMPGINEENTATNKSIGANFSNTPVRNYDELLAKEKLIWDLQQSIKELQAASAPTIGFFDKMLGNLAENIPWNEVMGMVNGFINRPKNEHIQAPINSPNEFINKNEMTAKKTNSKVQAPRQLTNEELQRLGEATKRLAAFFPDIVIAMEKFATLMETDDIARSIVITAINKK